MKKSFLLVTMLCIFVGLFSGLASAEESDKVVANGPLIQLKASQVDQSVIDYFEANDVNVNNDSIIEVLPMTKNGESHTQSSNYNTILSVTNEEYGKINKEVLITFEEGEDGSLSVVDVPVVLDKDGVQPFDGETIEFPPDSWDDRLTIRGTAVFDLYIDINHFYSPWGVYFTYTKGTANDVSHIAVTYICEGRVYSIPDYVDQNRDTIHSVQVDQSNPNQSTMYSNTNYFEPGMAILPGSVIAGNSLTFEFTVDGSSDGYTVPF